MLTWSFLSFLAFVVAMFWAWFDDSEYAWLADYLAVFAAVSLYASIVVPCVLAVL